MKEGRKGVERLLRALSQNIDSHNVGVLAHLINYDERQLRQDIESIRDVRIIDVRTMTRDDDER